MTNLKKQIITYCAYIFGVLIEFNLVSSYGNSNLKAPSNFSGQYQLDFLQPPECLVSKDLRLTLQQSGIYLAGVLSETQHSRISLTGKYQEGKLLLKSPTTAFEDCLIQSQDSQIGISLNPEPQSSNLLKGNFTLNQTTSFPFQAKLIKAELSEDSASPHSFKH